MATRPVFIPNKIRRDEREAAEPQPALIVPSNKMLILDAPPTRIDNDATPWVSNFVTVDDGMQSRPALKTIGAATTPADVVMGGCLARFTDGTIVPIAVSKDKIYHYDGATDAWIEIVADSTESINGSNLLPVAFAMWPESDRLCFSQGTDNIQYIDGDLDKYYALSANAYPAYILEIYNRRLNLFKTVEGGNTMPQRHRYCAAGDITDWTGLGSGYRDLSDHDDYVLAAKRMTGALYAYKTDSITRITATGIATAPFQYEQSWSVGRGLLAGRSLASRGLSHYGLFSDGVFSYNGAQFSPIGNGRVNRYIIDSVDPGATPLTFVRGHYNPSKFEYTLIYPSASASFCNRVFVYNERQNLWYYHTFPYELSDIFDYVAATGVTIDQLVGTIEQQSWIFDSAFSRSGYHSLLLAAVDGTASKMSRFDHTAFGDYSGTLDVEYQSKDFKVDKPRHMTTMCGLGVSYVDYGAYTITVQVSTDGGTTWNTGRTLALGGSYDGSVKFAWSWFEVTGDTVRFRVTGSSDNRLKIVSFHPIVADGGEVF